MTYTHIARKKRRAVMREIARVVLFTITRNCRSIVRRRFDVRLRFRLRARFRCALACVDHALRIHVIKRATYRVVFAHIRCDPRRVFDVLIAKRDAQTRANLFCVVVDDRFFVDRVCDDRFQYARKNARCRVGLACHVIVTLIERSRDCERSHTTQRNARCRERTRETTRTIDRFHNVKERHEYARTHMTQQYRFSIKREKTRFIA